MQAAIWGLTGQQRPDLDGNWRKRQPGIKRNIYEFRKEFQPTFPALSAAIYVQKRRSGLFASVNKEIQRTRSFVRNSANKWKQSAQFLEGAAPFLRERFGCETLSSPPCQGGGNLAFVFRNKQCRVFVRALQLWPISGFVPGVLDFPAWNMHCISIVLLPHKGPWWRGSDGFVIG